MEAGQEDHAVEHHEEDHEGGHEENRGEDHGEIQEEVHILKEEEPHTQAFWGESEVVGGFGCASLKEGEEENYWECLKSQTQLKETARYYV